MTYLKKVVALQEPEPVLSIEGFNRNQIIECIKANPSFENIYWANHTAVDDKVVKTLFKYCKNIKVLDLSGTKITVEVFDFLKEERPEIEEVYLSQTDIRKKTLDKLGTYCPNIKNLVVSHCKAIADQAVISIANLFSNLTHLDLGFCNNVSDVGAVAIAESECRKKLTFLGLNDTSVGDNGVSRISDAAAAIPAFDVDNSKVSAGIKRALELVSPG